MQKYEKKSQREPKEKMPADFHIEADRCKEGISMSVAGVNSIVDFSEERVLLRVKKGRVEVHGASLSVTVYENKIIEITGKISGVSFL